VHAWLAVSTAVGGSFGFGHSASPHPRRRTPAATTRPLLGLFLT
jgi:hypothetical protein